MPSRRVVSNTSTVVFFCAAFIFSLFKFSLISGIKKAALKGGLGERRMTHA